jgi:CDP-diacylglycerol--serine O-phosphatidyltransferase
MRGNDSEREKLPVVSLLPNLVTILGLCAGLTSIWFVLGGDFRSAAALIVFAALIDGLDGFLARRLKATSDFGAELDSLSDFVNFGVAPGLLVFQALLNDARGIGWVFVLFFSICCCLRLARFNVAKAREASGEQEPKRHFVGVPAPGGALLALLPVFLLFAGIVDTSTLPLLAAFWLGLVGAAMVSQLPTFSMRSVFISRNKIAWLLIATPIVFGAVLTQFWLSLIVIDLIYILLLARSVVVTARRSCA